MKSFLQIFGGFLLVYSTAGVALHALAKVDGFGHHCEMLLFSMEENHLAIFTMTAGLSATLFFAAKRIGRRGMKKAA